MADSKVTIKIDADAEGAKRAFAEVQSSADAAMESGARSAQKLSKSLDNVAESAKVSARQIKTVAAGMASMAAGVAAAAMRANGMDTEARYAQSASSSAVQGATMMAPLGPLAMILGAAGGGALGLLKQYFEDDAIGNQQKEGVGNAVESLAKAREEMDRVAERTDDFQKLLQTLGNTTADAASREKLLADEIEKRKQGEDGAREKMKAAEAAMKSFQATIDGPMTKEQEKYFATLQEDWKNAAKELQTNRAERKSLEGQKIEKDKPEYEADRVSEVLSGLEKAGIGYAAIGANKLSDWQAKGGVYFDQNAAALESLVAPAADAADKTTAAVEDGNDIAERQLDVLKEISAKTTGTAVFA